MSQMPVTIVGHLTQDPILQKVAPDVFKTTLRVASSRRYSVTDHNGVEWKETDALFVDVEAWGSLAQHVRQCLAKGMPVLVIGSLNSSGYTDRDGTKRTKYVVRAAQIGLDLNRYLISSRKVDVPLSPEGLSLPEIRDIEPDKDFTKDSSQDTAADRQAAEGQNLQEGSEVAAAAGALEPPF